MADLETFREETHRWLQANAPASMYATYKTTDDSGRTMRKWIKKAEDGKRPGPYLVLAAAAGAEGERRNELKAKIRASSAAAHWLEKGL